MRLEREPGPYKTVRYTLQRVSGSDRTRIFLRKLKTLESLTVSARRAGRRPIRMYDRDTAPIGGGGGGEGGGGGDPRSLAIGKIDY